jgi:hypothetical protein
MSDQPTRDDRPRQDERQDGDKAAAGPRLHIDSDWKAQAQAEKERLARIEAEREKEREARGGGSDDLPPADFKSLVGVLASQALMGLGSYADQQGRVVVDLLGSRFSIDLLGVLEEKTKGNLSDEEAKELAAVLGELRSRFVQIATIVAQQSRAGTGAGAADPSVVGRIDAGRATFPTGGGRTPIIEVP